jgi:thiamine-phosphate pyrophosphorylase
MTNGIRESGLRIRPAPNSKADLPTLTAIVDADAAERAGWTVLDLAAAYLAGGARVLQLRAKHASSGWLLDAAAAIASAARAIGAIAVVNDRADVARLAAADGVHVGQQDLAPGAVRRIVGAGALVGLSTHDMAQLEHAVLEPVNYVAIGPVYRTTTKATGYQAVGLDLVRAAARRAHERGLPVVAIGGITLERASDVLAAGADSVAVISDLMTGGDPEARVRAYLDRLARVPKV